jgi:flagellar export protein FliJ
VTGLELAGLHGFLDHNARLDRLLVRRLTEAGTRLEAARTRLMEAERKVRVLEKLEEQTRRKWKLEFDRELEGLAGEAHLARWKGAGRPR